MTQGTQPSPRNDFAFDLGDTALTARVADGMRAVEGLLAQRLEQG